MPHWARLKVYHSASTDSGGGGGKEVHGFKNETHSFTHRYDLPWIQAQFFVIVENSIHVLNPNRINRSIEK